MRPTLIRVVLDVPLFQAFDYRVPPWVEAPPSGELIDPWAELAPGWRVLVPFGRRRLVGVVVEVLSASALPPAQLREILLVCDDAPPLPPDWLALAQFASNYYHRPAGEVMLAALPLALRRAPKRKPTAVPRTRKKAKALTAKAVASESHAAELAPFDRSRMHEAPALTPDQEVVLTALTPWLNPLNSCSAPAQLVHGITGSGKTEIYLRLAQAALARGGQVLVLVPEINLTPQIFLRFEARFPDARIVSLHSGLTDAQRLRHWLAAWQGEADVVVGTRLSVMTPLPRLALIVVDEEHDPSYKQQEGVRYSARDLAIWRGRQRKVPVVLGSATPSLESWHHAQLGRYGLHTLAARAVAAARLPQVKLLAVPRSGLAQGFSEPLLDALQQRLAKGEQSLIFLNRRGYAPVLHCDACGWGCYCTRCSALMVVHRLNRAAGAAWAQLLCHQCGLRAPAPSHCPQCGNADIRPMGRGTQRVESFLSSSFPDARIARLDIDAAAAPGGAQAILDAVHQGETDILVGTQMLSKGHDFSRVTLVGVLQADQSLFSPDFRATERLFAQLMQVGGRSGRAQLPGEVLIQTQYPTHPLYEALVAQDYPRFAAWALAERSMAHLPPFSHQALLRAQHPELQTVLDFLMQAKRMEIASDAGVQRYDPVPLRIVRVAGESRAQLLVESSSRAALQQFLTQWTEALVDLKSPLRWHIDVDPLVFS